MKAFLFSLAVVILYSVFKLQLVWAATAPGSIGTPQIPYQNISITNISVVLNTALQNSPVLVFLNISNKGTLASSNMTLNIYVSGPTPANLSYKLSPLSPGQRESVAARIKNATQSSGNYLLAATVYYTAQGSIRKSNTMKANYSVVAYPLAGSIPSGVASYIAALPQLTITDAPLFTFLAYGTSQLLAINFKDTSQYPENVSLSVPGIFSGILQFSTYSLTMTPNQTFAIQMLLKPTLNFSSGTYTVPINITATSNGAKSTQTYYLQFNVYKAINKPMVYGQVSLASASTIQGTLDIKNPTNSSLSNVILDTYVPISLGTIFGITTSGMPSNITQQTGFYVIHWNVGSIRPMQDVYAFYSIRTVPSTQLMNIHDILTVLSPVSQYSVLNVGNAVIPSFYVNSSSTVNISAIYTGTAPQQVSFIMTAPSGITIQNPVQTVNAVPNQVMTQKFYVNPGHYAGTYTLGLYVSTNNANYTYYLPMVVLQSPGQLAQAAQPSLLNSIVSLLSGHTGYAIAGSFLFLIILLGLVLRRRRLGPSVYSAERAERLLRIKKLMEPGSGDRNGE